MSLIHIRKRLLSVETLHHESGPDAPVPLHYIPAACVRSHVNTMEVGVQDGPRPDEILFALVIADLPLPEPGPGQARIHARAIGVARPEVLMRQGSYKWMQPLSEACQAHARLDDSRFTGKLILHP